MPKLWKLLPVALLAPLAAQATVVIKQSIEEMTSTSAAVVRGTVLRQEARWDDAHHRIYTFTEVRVTERIKGTPAELILVRSPGGEVGRSGQRVEGSPKFQVGEDVVLFLEVARDDPSVFMAAALAAGKVTLQRTPSGGVHAVRDLTGISQYVMGSIDRQIPAPVGLEDLGPADAFLARVRKAAGR